MPDTHTTLPPEIVDSIAISGAKSIAEQPAILANLALSNVIANNNLAQQNALSNQQAMNQLGIAVTGKAVNLVSTLSPLEARSAVEVLSGNDVAQEIADLKAAMEAFAGTEDDTPKPATGTT